MYPLKLLLWNSHPVPHTRPLPKIQRRPTVCAHNFPLHLIISSGPQTGRTISRSGNGIFTGLKEKLRVLSNLRSPEATFQTAGIVVTAGAGRRRVTGQWPPKRTRSCQGVSDAKITLTPWSGLSKFDDKEILVTSDHSYFNRGVRKLSVRKVGAVAHGSNSVREGQLMRERVKDKRFVNF